MSAKKDCLAFCGQNRQAAYVVILFSGYHFFGLQYAKQCFCGNDFNNYGKKPGTECIETCTGDEKVRCGGTWRNSVYTTGLRGELSLFVEVISRYMSHSRVLILTDYVLTDSGRGQCNASISQLSKNKSQVATYH